MRVGRQGASLSSANGALKTDTKPNLKRKIPLSMQRAAK